MPRSLLLLLALPLALPTRAAEPEVVQLRFAWPASAEARVTYARERTRTGREPMASKLAYGERVERRGDELWVLSGGLVGSVAELPGLPPGEGAAAAAELARAAEGMARVVGRDGRYLRIEGLDRAGPAILRVLETSLPPAQRELAGRVMRVLEPALGAESQAHWAYAVTTWAGRDLDLGWWYEATSKAESPLAPGVPVTYRTRFGAIRRLPCDGEPGPPRCVELTLRSTPDPAEIPAMLEAMTRRIASQAAPGRKPPEGPLFRDVRLADEVRVITDPKTLLPRSVQWTRSSELTGTDGKALVQRDVKSWTYAWKAPAR